MAKCVGVRVWKIAIPWGKYQKIRGSGGRGGWGRWRKRNGIEWVDVRGFKEPGV
jgi:hypothetical protein